MFLIRLGAANVSARCEHSLSVTTSCALDEFHKFSEKTTFILFLGIEKGQRCPSRYMFYFMIVAYEVLSILGKSLEPVSGGRCE